MNVTETRHECRSWEFSCAPLAHYATLSPMTNAHQINVGSLASNQSLNALSSRLWGKWAGQGVPLPLLAHMLDTAAVALLSWDLYSPQIRVNATAILAPASADLARTRFAVLAALHDIGKASREFTGQMWGRHSDEFAAHRVELARLGLPMEVPQLRPDLTGDNAAWVRHEAITGLILGAHTALPGWARRVITGHHGRYARGGSRDIPIQLEDLRARALTPEWAAVQRDLIDQMVAAVTVNTGQPVGLDDWPEQVAAPKVPFLIAMTGLVSVCDWIASDDNFTRSAPREFLAVGNTQGYLLARVEQAGSSLLGVLGDSSTPVGDFPALFAGRSPRGATQKWAVAKTHGPGLTIVMAPMGEGKTEVALHMHASDGSVAAGRPAGDGLFFGLPTMATADAMFTRIQAFWDGTSATGRLAHSQAILNDFYAPSTISPAGVCEHLDPATREARAGLQPADWFTGRHRGLLAPVTVGTVDQVLAAALDHKYVQVRLAALAGKHVVLDEIHTYDAYQHVLLCRLLGWLGAFRCRVTLLSATLPRVRVEQIAEAWSSGWHAGAPAQIRDEVIGNLPNSLPYPAVVTVDDMLVCEQLEAWRHFTLAISCQELPAAKAEFLAGTVALVQKIRAENPRSRIGVLVNSIDRAIAVFGELAPGERGESVLLHSRMTAGQRRHHTARLHSLVGPDAPAGPVLVVATQVAEASLDLDLDILVTDLAPMASIIQRTGRLWRHSVNIGEGWTHPEHLSYRTGNNPMVHILAPVTADGQIAAGANALPYTTAELRQAWTEHSCLDKGGRTSFAIPQDLQPAIDAAFLTLDSLIEQAEDESDDAKQILQHLGEQLAKTASAARTGANINTLAKKWRKATGPDPWGKDEPDWSQLTAPILWDQENGVVTRLQEQQQAQLLIWDSTGDTRWAWHGEPSTILGNTANRGILLAALDGSVPVSGYFAAQVRQAAEPHLPPKWEELAPPLLRGLVPISVTALAALAELHPDLGLIRLESTV